MNRLAALLTSTIAALWIGTIAVLSIQNFTPVSLRFLTVRSFEIPIGLVLAFSVGIGLVGSAIAQPLLDFSTGERFDDEE